MGIINILALNEKEIEILKLFPEYAEKKVGMRRGKSSAVNYWKIPDLSITFSIEENGKLQGGAQKAKGYTIGGYGYNNDFNEKY